MKKPQLRLSQNFDALEFEEVGRSIRYKDPIRVPVLERLETLLGRVSTKEVFETRTTKAFADRLRILFLRILKLIDARDKRITELEAENLALREALTANSQEIAEAA